jgi:acyl carrier protein
MMTKSETRNRTLHYLSENFLYMRRDYELTDDASLLEEGIIDSMGVMELVAFVEQELGVPVRDDEITEDNFGTLRSIVDYVESRRHALSFLAT